MALLPRMVPRMSVTDFVLLMDLFIELENCLPSFWCDFFSFHMLCLSPALLEIKFLGFFGQTFFKGTDTCFFTILKFTHLLLR